MSGMRRMRLGSETLGVAIAVTLLATAARAEKVDRLEIVDRAIEHHGGELFERSRTSLEVCSKSGCSAVQAAMRDGLFEYDITGQARSVERRVLATNETVEWWEDGEMRPVRDAEHAQGLRDWAMQRVYFNFLPYRLNDPSVFKEDLGLEEWEGRSLYKVKVSFEPGTSTDASDEYLYWFDPDTARLELFAYSYEVNGGGLRFRRLFDYRRVGGLLFYNQENWGVEGPELDVDLVTPAYVAGAMRRVSTIEVKNVLVEALSD